MTHPKLRALCSRIGETLLLDILRDFYRRMSKDILIGFFFTGKDTDLIAERQAQFMLAAMGIHKEYHGKTPTIAHLELPPILAGHFDRRIEILRQTLKDHHLNDKDIRTWIGFEKAFRNVVVS